MRVNQRFLALKAFKRTGHTRTRKRTSRPTKPTVVACAWALPLALVRVHGILTGFFFGPRARRGAPYRKPFGRTSKTTDRGETHFPPNLYPLWPTRFSLVYLLLSQRSALNAASSFSRTLFDATLTPTYLTSPIRSHDWSATHRLEAFAASIFIAGEFGRCVVTRSLADGDFHAHRPSVWILQQIFWGLERFDFAALASLSVHPASPARLTQDGPLGDPILRVRTIELANASSAFKF